VDWNQLNPYRALLFPWGLTEISKGRMAFTPFGTCEEVPRRELAYLPSLTAGDAPNLLRFEAVSCLFWSLINSLFFANHQTAVRLQRFES
jgi:hypothetical protein